jgi:hypothetical protein
MRSQARIQGPRIFFLEPVGIDNGAITESELPEVMRAKYELLGRDSPLSFEYETAQFTEIGGMQRLRQ